MSKKLYKEIKQQIKDNKVTFAVYMILRGFLIAAIVMSSLQRNYEAIFFCSLALILFLIPAFIEKNFKIDIPSPLEITILLFIFATAFLGELREYYIKFPFWDTMLHTINGFLCAAIGFALVDIVNRNPKFKFELSPMFLAIVAFCFSMTIGVLWEFYEFAVDRLFLTDMQKDTVISVISSVMINPDGTNTPTVIEGITDTVINGQKLNVNGYLDIGLYDTMKDLFVNFIGAVVFSIIGYFYVKSRGKNKFAEGFIPKIVEEDSNEQD